jgi:hypothetical protein
MNDLAAVVTRFIATPTERRLELRSDDRLQMLLVAAIPFTLGVFSLYLTARYKKALMKIFDGGRVTPRSE